MNRLQRLVALLVVALAAAGCMGGKDNDPGAGTVTEPGAIPMLHGYVFDPALRPLEGATVKVIDVNASFATTDEGFFGFEELPTEQFLVIVATKPGFIPASKQVTLVPDTPVRLNFTLQPEPVAVPYRTVLPFEGLIGCQAATVVSTTNNTFDCNNGLEERRRYDFSVEADLAGAVIEVYWEPTTQAAASLGLRLETLELGQLNIVLGDVVGPSPLRVSVPQSTAERYYSGGGLMRLTMFAASDSHQNEAGVGASVAFQQAFEAYISLFYVEPPSDTYSIADG